MKSILDPTFRYSPSFDTDLRRTFARIRREHPQATKRGTGTTGSGLAMHVVSLADVSVLRNVTAGHQR